MWQGRLVALRSYARSRSSSALELMLIRHNSAHAVLCHQYLCCGLLASLCFSLPLPDPIKSRTLLHQLSPHRRHRETKSARSSHGLSRTSKGTGRSTSGSVDSGLLLQLMEALMSGHPKSHGFSRPSQGGDRSTSESVGSGLLL